MVKKLRNNLYKSNNSAINSNLKSEIRVTHDDVTYSLKWDSIAEAYSWDTL
jgi:hypothetical protein